MTPDNEYGVQTISLKIKFGPKLAGQKLMYWFQTQSVSILYFHESSKAVQEGCSFSVAVFRDVWNHMCTHQYTHKSI